MKKTAAKKGNPELIEALNAIEKEKDISKETLLDAIENSLLKIHLWQHAKMSMEKRIISV